MSHSSSLRAYALALLLAAGVQAFIIIVLVLAEKPLDRLFESDNPGRLLVHPGGEVVLAQPFAGYRTLSGARFEADDGQNAADPPWLSATWLSAPLSERQRYTRLGWYARMCELPGDPQAVWFLVHTSTMDGQAYLVGYDGATKQPIGYLGRSGYRSSLPDRDEWFEMAGAPRNRLASSAVGSQTPAGIQTIESSAVRRGVVYLAANDRIWEVDLAARKVREFFDSTATVSVAAATLPERRTELLVRTKSEVIAVDFRGRRRTSWRIPAELSAHDFQWYALADGTALAQRQRTAGNVLSVDFTWIRPDGTITRNETLEAQFGLPMSGPTAMFLLGAMTPSPLVFTPAAVVAIPGTAVSQGEAPDLPTGIAHALADAWPALLLVYLLSAALAWFAYRRQTRYALPGPGAWAVLVFVCGVPGWLGYLWHRRWPIVEPCAECHRPVPRDRQNCTACGRVFAPPALMGTEIFA